MRARSWGLPALAVGLAAMSLQAHAAPTLQATPPAAAPQAPTGPVVTYTVEQLVTGALAPAIQQQLAPLRTLRDCEDLLKANQIAFGWRRADVGTDKLSADLARQIAALPPGEVFIIPTAQGVTINVIVGKR